MNLSELRAAAGDARTAIATSPAATTAWTDARDNLQNIIGRLGGDDALGQLHGDVPLALLPVRLETRYATGADALHVRIFPADVHVDGHIEELTDAELARGAALWAAPADLPADGETPVPSTGASDGRRALWAALVTTYGDRRAVHIARTTRPVVATDGTVTLAAPPTVPDAYARPPVARGLPDRWLVRCYVGGSVVASAWSGPVRADLHVGPDPRATPPIDDMGGPRVDPELRWLVDYDAAVAAGMAVDVGLPPGTDSLDRVVVAGLRTSGNPTAGATELSELIAAHAVSDGAGFVATGTPTSNAPDGRSGFDRKPDPFVVWEREFGPVPQAPAAQRAETALGVASGTLARLDGAGWDGDADARAMQTLLWAATWGYYLTSMLDGGLVGALPVDDIRSLYLDHVRGRGTQPVLRVGAAPYGLLPVVPLANWVTGHAPTPADGIAALLQRLRPLFAFGVGVPLAQAEGTGFDAAFTRVMSTDALARHARVRTAVADRIVDVTSFLGVSINPVAVQDVLVGSLLGLGGNPFVLSLFSSDSQPVRAPFVVDATDPNPDATVAEALNGLKAVNPIAAITQQLLLKPRPEGPATVLHTLARRSVLLEWGNAGTWLTRLHEATGTVAPGAVVKTFGTGKFLGRNEPAATVPIAAASTQWAVAQTPQSSLIGLTPAAGGGFVPPATMPGVLTAALTNLTGSMPVGEWLWRNPGLFLEVRSSLDETLEALGRLATRTAAELELLLCETLDLASHRWTAWAEGVASAALAQRRADGVNGVVVGGWGVVERVVRSGGRPATLPDALATDATLAKRTVVADTNAGGFVHAPSPAQAATAAVLRAAHLAHGGESDPSFAVQLDSRSAREAIRLATGVRNGQPLGALLGYEIERRLHERNADRLIAPLRAHAPQWQASGTFVEGQPTDIVSPSAVVDGLQLVRAGADAVVAAVAPGDLEQSLRDVLAEAADHARSLSDLLVAESVHQSLLGNSARANAALDAAHRGGVPPEQYDVLRTPRAGAALTCRVAVVLDAADADAPKTLAGGWRVGPRERADLPLARWVAGLLPPVDRVRVRVTGGDVALPALGPLSLVLDRPETVRARVLLAAGAAPVAGRDAGWSTTTVSLDELLAVADDLCQVLTRRALRDADLQPAAPAGAPASADERDAADLAGRVSAAATDIAAAAATVRSCAAQLAPDAATGLDSAAARAALAGALDVGVALLPKDLSNDQLITALRSALAECDRRAALPVPDASAGADALVAALKALLGETTPALVRFVPASAGALSARLTAGASVTAGEIEDFLDITSDVRPELARAGEAFDGCEALAFPAGLLGDWAVLEHAGAGAGGWTALRTAEQLAALGPVATAVLRVDAEGATLPATVAGIVIDDWTEVVPAPTAATTVAYEGDTPPARAPQAILLGLHPDPTATWTADLLCDVVLEALDWARLRTADADSSAWVGRMLPALLLPDGDATDVIAAPPFPLLEIDPAVLLAARAKAKEFG